MNYQEMDSVILNQVQTLNSQQKFNVINYLENLPKTNHNQKMYRRKALKQIREALQNA